MNGWFDYQALYADVARWAPFGARLVEVGSWLGKSALYLDEQFTLKSGADMLPQAHLILVDHCIGSVGGRDYPAHKKVLDKYNGTTAGALHQNVLNGKSGATEVSILVAPSVWASKLFPDGTVDFVFIDAGHNYDDVITDLATWGPKVRKGGRIAGHDYGREWPGVIQAVDEFYGKMAAVFPGTRSCWHVQL